MRGTGASAGTIKSGGVIRRAAKMVVLDVDYPDIEDFKETKVKEEEKIHLLRDAWLRHAPGNNSVRVNDEFMKPVSWGFLRRNGR